MDDGRTCRACGSPDLQPAGWPPGWRAVCAHCGRCWQDGGDGAQVDTIACPGCAQRGTCESCATWLAESLTRHHVLPDGGEVVIRPLLYGDRFELAARFGDLSVRSRQFRFLRSHEELDTDDIEYLTNIDYRDHFACVAILPTTPVPTGIGVGRYIREQDDPAVAEVAVTVVDEHQRRGVGTLLLRTLSEVAAENGIRTFVSYVLWRNSSAIDLLMDQGARVVPAEPGVARIEVDLPARVGEITDPSLHRIIAGFAARVRALGQARQRSS